MNLIYLACPYSDPSEEVRLQRVVEADRVAGMLVGHGYAVFSPISYSHRLVKSVPASFGDGWYEFDLEFLRRSDLVLVLQLPGWEQSRGVALERDEANKWGIPIVNRAYPVPDETALAATLEWVLPIGSRYP